MQAKGAILSGCSLAGRQQVALVSQRAERLSSFPPLLPLRGFPPFWERRKAGRKEGGRAAAEMSKKRGLSAEEKRTRMMEIFFETKDVFQLKDIEKIAPKEKGITSMSVKEVLQSLVDDGMVDSDRIGTSNYFWAFPSKALHARRRKLEELQTQFSEFCQKKNILEESIEKSKIGRQDTAERAALTKQLAALRQKKEQLKAEIDKYKECDPDVVEEIRQANQVAKEAANRWTDNIFAVKSWAKRKFGFEDSKIDKTFGIPEDFDYID
ncbi:meiotic nuclear division protein 1 homolog isoform X2 [Sceloporus undulatus]|uniref:meiotic nuclear division protein 1 homolog isoform X2 n=1 Tax=Sceloporus undulatus TaxID=8520 RepID=UPI001C4D4817|nr:meiotic nuclear division protein 1 homolog isoform X2 [Sceloporus undulatus]